MKNLIIAMSLLLASCGTLGGLNSATFIAQIQNAAITICAFEPTVAMVAALISANPAVAVVTDMATAVCAVAVPKKALRRALVHSHVVIPLGLKAEGAFVK